MDVTISKIGENRGAKRVWLQGEMLNKAGFGHDSRFNIEKRDGGLVLSIGDNGTRKVSKKDKNDKVIPIIDINSNETLAIFEGLEVVRVIFKENAIYIMPLASEVKARERLQRVTQKMQAGEPLTFGSLAHGGGVMDDALDAGFTAAGLTAELAFANEIRSDLTDHAMELGRTWKRSTIALNAPMQEIAFDDYVMSKVGRVDVLAAGLPCSGASVAGRAKRGLVHPESHPEVGHLVVAFLAIIAKVNPAAIILENVVPYSSSASMDIIRTQLANMQYELQEAVMDGADFGSLEPRKRMVMVAVTKGMEFSFDAIEKPAVTASTLADVLEDIPLDDASWSEMKGLKDKEIRDAKAGKSFAMQIFTADSDHICTLTKGMQKNRSTDAKIQHPTNPDLLRIPTPTEHARIKHIPEAMIAGLCKTTAHEMLGQSVIYSVFVALGKVLANAFQRLTVIREEIPFALAA